MQTHLYFWCAGIVFSATYSLENCKHFEAKVVVQWMVQMVPGVPSTIPLGDFLRDFTTIRWSPIFRGSNWPPISEEVPIKGQSSTSFRPQKDVKDGFLGNQPFIMREMVGWVTLFDHVLTSLRFLEKQHKSRLAEPRNYPETLWIWRLFEGPCQVECCFLPGVPQKRGWRKWANLGSQPKKTSNRLYIGLPPCPVCIFFSGRFLCFIRHCCWEGSLYPNYTYLDDFCIFPHTWKNSSANNITNCRHLRSEAVFHKV